MFSDNSPTSASMAGYYIDYSFVSLDDNVTPGDAFGEHTVFKAMPYFMDTTNNDFRLQPCSPAVNWGLNLAIDTLGIVTDLDGNPRIVFDTVDIGAYETQDSCFVSNSEEPRPSPVAVMLSPNPSPPGSPLEVRAEGFLASKINWVIWDSYGRSVSMGERHPHGKGSFFIESPRNPGVYFLELCSAQQSAWLKFVMQR